MLITRKQSLADVALNVCGTMEALWGIAAANNVSVSDIANVNDNYIMPVISVNDINALQYAGSNKILFATLGNRPGTGIEYMEIGIDFIIS